MDIIKDPSPNKSLSKYKKSIVVIHKTRGSFEGALAWLKNPESKVSANYLISREGKIVELVNPIFLMAWQAGKISNPSRRAKQVMLKNFWGGWVNPNKYSIGIEFAARDNETFTDAQIEAGAELIKSFDIEFTGVDIITHQDLTDYKPELERERFKLLKEIFSPPKNKETLNNNEDDMLFVKTALSPNIYLIRNEKRIMIIDMPTLKAYQSDVKEISEDEMKAYPENGTMIWVSRIIN